MAGGLSAHCHRKSEISRNDAEEFARVYFLLCKRIKICYLIVA